jgi:hypothetical protein
MNSRLHVATLAGFALLAPGAHRLHAQTNHQSDVAGTIVTGSDVLGGIFVAIPGQVVSFPSAAAAAQVTAALTALQAAATQAALAGNTTAGAVLQPSLAAVLTCGSSCGTATAALTVNLRGVSGTAMAEPVAALVTALKGLAASPETMSLPTMALQVNAARTAFVRLIESASVEYLSNPPEELIAVHKMLVTLVTAANAQ